MARNSLPTRGFTLIELMIVVVIIGVLAATAIPAFGRQVKRARAAEAPVMLGRIRMAQESYLAEHGQYFGTTTATAWWPTSAPSEQSVGWNGASASNPLRLLGINPDGPVYFRYRLSAGFANAPDPPYSGTWNDWWYVAQAQGDLNGDGTTYFLEAIAGRRNIYNSSANGWD